MSLDPASSPALLHVEHVMGMAISIDIRPPIPPVAALDAVIDWWRQVDETYSTYRFDSDISRLGRAEIGLEDLPAEVGLVLRRCVELTELTGGAFDAFAVPAPNGTTLDPSGLVKGWSVERAAALLEGHGATNFCINAGGDIVLRGLPAMGENWRIGIRHPEHADRQATVLRLAGPKAVATSATYERGAHIIDPRTGSPTTELASVTVIGPDLGDADAFATALFVMGADGLDWIETQPGYEAYVITHDETTHWSSGFAVAWPA